MIQTRSLEINLERHDPTPLTSTTLYCFCRFVNNVQFPSSAYEGVTAAPASEPLPRETPTRRSEHEDLPPATICANLHEKVR